MTKKRMGVILLAAAFLAAFSFASGPQDKPAAHKYEPYCGEYNIDLSSYGGGLVTAKVYIENDVLTIWADRSEPPDILKPVENSETKFFLDDPEEGHWEIEFLKDDQGKFAKCRLINSGLGIDVVAERIKEQK